MVAALFEVLGFDELLEDAGVHVALVEALLRLEPVQQLDLASGGRYPGLYRLLAHHSSAIRYLVRCRLLAILSLPETPALMLATSILQCRVTVVSWSGSADNNSWPAGGT